MDLTPTLKDFRELVVSLGLPPLQYSFREGDPSKNISWIISVVTGKWMAEIADMVYNDDVGYLVIRRQNIVIEYSPLSIVIPEFYTVSGLSNIMLVVRDILTFYHNPQTQMLYSARPVYWVDGTSNYIIPDNRLSKIKCLFLNLNKQISYNCMSYIDPIVVSLPLSAIRGDARYQVKSMNARFYLFSSRITRDHPNLMESIMFIQAVYPSITYFVAVIDPHPSGYFAPVADVGPYLLNEDPRVLIIDTVRNMKIIRSFRYFVNSIMSTYN